MTIVPFPENMLGKAIGCRHKNIPLPDLAGQKDIKRHQPTT